MSEADRPDDPPARAVIDYKEPEVPPPVTRRERVIVVSGYVLLVLGFLLVAWSLDGRPAGDSPMRVAGLAVLLLGGAVTAFCFIYNAIRRM